MIFHHFLSCRRSSISTADTSNSCLNDLLSLGVGELTRGRDFNKPVQLTTGCFNQSVLLRDRKEQVQQFLSLVWDRWSTVVRRLFCRDEFLHCKMCPTRVFIAFKFFPSSQPHTAIYAPLMHSGCAEQVCLKQRLATTTRSFVQSDLGYTSFASHREA